MTTDTLTGKITFNYLFFGTATSSANYCTVFPGNFPRLAYIGETYEEYFFRSVKLDFVSAMSTATGGMFGFCVDYDYRNPAPSNTDFNSCMSKISSSAGSVYSDQSLLAEGKLALFNRYACSASSLSDDRVEYQMVVNAVSTYTSGGVTVGLLWCEYDVEFYAPREARQQWTLSMSSAEFHARRLEFFHRNYRSNSSLSIPEFGISYSNSVDDESDEEEALSEKTEKGPDPAVQKALAEIEGPTSSSPVKSETTTAEKPTPSVSEPIKTGSDSPKGRQSKSSGLKTQNAPKFKY